MTEKDSSQITGDEPLQSEGQETAGEVSMRRPATAFPGETNPFLGIDNKELRRMKAQKSMAVGQHKKAIEDLIDDINYIDWAIQAQE